MRKILLSLFFVLISLYADAQKTKPAYRLFTGEGKKASYDKMMDRILEADVLFIGEYHNNPISHWLQFEIVRQAGKTRPLILGAEMFEADNQQALDAYLLGEIDENQLDSLARLWQNFKTDYQPVLDYARDNGVAFVATNIPRRYANLVYKGGFEVLDTLSDEEKKWIAPLPMHYDAQLPSYQNMLKMMGDHSSPTMPMAQASKDATMAHFINQHLEDGKLFIHLNGSYHSDYKEGIVYYLNLLSDDLNIMTITTVEQETLENLDKEHLRKADYIICVDEDMTRTY